jgi:putative transposase
MKAHEGNYRVVRMTSALKVSRSGYYRSRGGRTSPRAAEDKELRKRVLSIHQESRETYGSPRITRELQKENIRLGKNRVARLMREAGISGVGRRRRTVRTTCSDGSLPVAPNRLKGLVFGQG